MLTMICVLVLRFQYDRGSSLQETLASTAIVCFLLLVVSIEDLEKLKYFN